MSKYIFRKSESRVFSQNIAITVPNLISFVLTNLNPMMRLESMYYLCNRTKVGTFQIF